MAFWNDLTPKQRFAIPEGELPMWVRAEMMNAGVKPTYEPTYEPEPTIPELPKTQVFIVEHKYRASWGYEYTHQVVFPTKGAADTFMLLPAMYGEEADSVVPLYGPSLRIEDRYTPENKAKIREIQKEAEAVIKRNKAMREEYEKELKAEQEIQATIREEWYEAHRLNRKYEKVMNTFTEYIGMTENNNEATAFAFLVKTFGATEVQAAFDWCERALPAGNLGTIEV